MSADLLEQLAQYGADHRARQAPVEMSEIRGQVRGRRVRADATPPARTGPSRSGFLIAAAVVVLVVAGLVWLSRADDQEPVIPADTAVVTPPPVTEAETAATTIATSPFAVEVAPGEVGPALSAPAADETQRSIVGDITWSVVEGDNASVPDVKFVADGRFFGATGRGPGPLQETPEQWWSSPDGVTWTPTDVDAPTPLTIHQTTEPVWASSGDLLFRWDDGGFVPVDLPAAGSVEAEGLVVRRQWVSSVAEVDDALIVRRDVILAVPWTELLGVEPPSEVIEEGGLWENEDTFRVREAQCTETDDGQGRECGGFGAQWLIRPEIVEADPVRIDFYDNATGELITSITPPDVNQPIEEVLLNIGFENTIAVGDELLVVRDDRVDSLRVPWSPVDTTHYAALGDELFALVERGERAGIWASTDLENWERRSDLPTGDDRGNFWLTSDGTTMVLAQHDLDTEFRANWTTTDGRSWTATNSALGGPYFRIEPTEFGWFQQGDPDPAPDGADPRAPSIAVSPDGDTWQVIPIPEPPSLSASGLTWADAADLGYWNWYPAEVHADAIFITLIDSVDGELTDPEAPPDHLAGGRTNRTLWVGQVDG